MVTALGVKRPLIAICVQRAMTPQNKAKRLLIARVLSTHELSVPLLSMPTCQAIDLIMSMPFPWIYLKSLDTDCKYK